MPGTFLNRFGTFVVPFLALHLTRREFSRAQAGIALGAYEFGHLGASLLGGHLADTFGRRKTILLSMFTSAVSMLLFSLANSDGEFLRSRCWLDWQQKRIGQPPVHC